MMNNQNGQKHGHDNNKAEEIAVLATETEAHFPRFKTTNSALGRRSSLSVRKKGYDSQVLATRDKKRWVGPAPVVWLVRKLRKLTGEDGSYTVA